MLSYLLKCLALLRRRHQLYRAVAGNLEGARPAPAPEQAERRRVGVDARRTASVDTPPPPANAATYRANRVDSVRVVGVVSPPPAGGGLSELLLLLVLRGKPRRGRHGGQTGRRGHRSHGAVVVVVMMVVLDESAITCVGGAAAVSPLLLLLVALLGWGRLWGRDAGRSGDGGAVAGKRAEVEV